MSCCAQRGCAVASAPSYNWENRRLRVPELKRLFTYPDDFDLVGGRASVQAQIGNSVPPLVARLVTESLIPPTGA